jgi:hypothetical protein
VKLRYPKKSHNFTLYSKPVGWNSSLVPHLELSALDIQLEEVYPVNAIILQGIQPDKG